MTPAEGLLSSPAVTSRFERNCPDKTHPFSGRLLGLPGVLLQVEATANKENNIPVTANLPVLAEAS